MFGGFFVINVNEIAERAKELGFSVAAPIDVSILELREDVRAACAENKCGKYGTNWGCPPGCGELEDLRKLISNYKYGILVQTLGELEDEFDFETTIETGEKHNKLMQKISSELSKEYSILPLGAGPCQVCKNCAYPNPCVNEKHRVISMEALGLWVSGVCRKNNIDYYHGKGKLAFVGCILIAEK